MKKNNSWREEAWENFLKKHWDNRSSGVNRVRYTSKDLAPILSKYKKSGQGEIRIFHYEHEKLDAVKKRNIAKIPISRTVWEIIKRPSKINFEKPKGNGEFKPKNKLTEGMIAGINHTMNLKTNPGETTLLAIANHTGIIADFYNLKEPGILFTGGRQSAGIHVVVDNNEIDMTKALIEIDGGFEWPETIVIAEMKSSFNQQDFDINQVLIPMLKWKNLLKNKKIYSIVLLAETKKDLIEYWAYNFIENISNSNFGMKINRSKRYILQI